MSNHTHETIKFDDQTKSIIIFKNRGIIKLRINNWLLWEMNDTNDFWAIGNKIFSKTYTKLNDVTLNNFTKTPIEIDYFYFENNTKEK